MIALCQNSIIADSMMGYIAQLTPFIEPAANMIFRRNVFANITTTSAADGKLAYGTNTLTQGTLATSGSLAPFSNYGFAKGAPPGWPALNLTDKVIKEFDRNVYFGVQGHTLAAMQALGWEKASGGSRSWS